MKQKGFAPILMVILIALAVGGYLLYQKQTPLRQDFAGQTKPVIQPTSVPSINPSASNSTADTFIQNYYNTYLACLNKHFDNVNSGKGNNKSPAQNCPFNANSDLTSTLDSQIQNGKNRGGDPILCAQDLPVSITFDKANVLSNGTAIVVVHPKLSMSPPYNINVGLQERDNKWKIASIDCNKN